MAHIYENGISFAKIQTKKQKMQKQLFKVFSILCLTMSSFSLMAQDSTGSMGMMKPSKSFSTFSIGFNAGVLKPSVPIGGSTNFTHPKYDIGYGGYIKDQLTHLIALQADFFRGDIKGDNSDKLGNGDATSNPYKSFKTDLNWTASLSAVATIGNINWLGYKNPIIPYVSVGGGLAGYKPTLITYNNTSIDYKPGNKDIHEFFVPVGAGLKFVASQAINIDLGMKMNFLDADNLDGYENGYHKDKFTYAFAGIEVAFGSKKHPQLIANNPVADLKQDLMDRNNQLRASIAASEQQNANTIDSLNGQLSRLKMDSDKDGVSDYFDKCPNTSDSDKVDGSGCPLPKMAPPPAPVVNKTYIISQEDKRVVAQAIKDLQFDFGKATIRASSDASLDKVADLLQTKGFSLKLAGYTDAVGSVEKNLQLSKDRANAVKDYLVSKGADASKIQADGFGKADPIASNKTAAGRAKNRRVEFTLF